MIRLTRLNGGETYVNADLVATVEGHHDTVVTLVDGKTYVVQDTAEQIVAAIVDYRASVIAAAARRPLVVAEEPAGEARLLVLPQPAAKQPAGDRPEGGR